jgi:hypothetical protein
LFGLSFAGLAALAVINVIIAKRRRASVSSTRVAPSAGSDG